MPQNDSQAAPPRSKAARFLKRVVIYIAVIYLVWCAAVYFMQTSMMFPISFLGQPSDGPWREDAEVMTRDIGGGEQAVAWLFPAPDRDDAPTPLVVYAHGNGELIDTQRRVVNAYNNMGAAVLLVEFRGYGHAGGRPSQTALTEDAIHFFEVVRQRDDIDPERLIYHGRSLGGAVSAQLAKHHPPAAFIAESTFTHAGAFGWRFGVPPVLVKNLFRTKDVLATLDRPVLLFHGKRDGIIPPSHSEKLHALTPGSELFIYDNADHNNFPGGGNEKKFWAEIERFLREHAVLE